MKNKAGKFYLKEWALVFLGLVCGFSSLTKVSAAPGDLDFSFGTQGRQMILIPNLTIPNSLDWNPTEDIAFQPDGKILVAGSAHDTMLGFDFTVTRFNTDGSLDSSFAVNGVFRYDFNRADDTGYGIALQPDGKIIIVGEAYLGVFNNIPDTAFGIIRLNPNGSFDTTFGTGGIVITNFFGSLDAATEVALLPDGKIIATGYVTQGGVNTGDTYDFALVRYNSNGSLDTTFGSGGKVTTDFNGLGDLAQTSVLQRDGKIVLAGWVRITNAGQYDFGLARYNTDGSLDTTFDGDGKVVTTFGNNLSKLARGIALAPDGKIVVAGDLYNPPPITGQSGHFDVAAARYNTNGSLDTTFDSDGRFVYDSNLTDRNERAEDVVVQPDGKILFVGVSRLIVNAVPGVSDTDLQIIRLNVNGSFDSSFSSGGIVRTDWGIFNPPGLPTFGSGRTAEVLLSATIGLQADGKIVATNDSRRATNSRRLAIARYQNDITSNVVRRPAFDFDGDGRAEISIFRPSNGQWWISRSSSNVFAVEFGNGNDKIMPADFTGDGKTDLVFFRTSTGEWFVIRSEDNSFYAFPFGSNGDIPAVGDYDGDGRADAAVFRPSSATWFIQKSSGGVSIETFGINGDVPVVGDYDGDGKSDIAIFRPSNGQWWINRSTGGITALEFGTGADKPVPVDYTGDGKSDIAFWRESTGEWFILRSEDNSFYAFPFGSPGDVPAPADFDADGKADAAVFRSGVWYIQASTQGVLIKQFGVAGDIPQVGDYDGDGKADLAIFRPSNGQWWLNRSSLGVTAVTFGDANDKPVAADFTGDGKTDIAFFRPADGNWFILRSEDSSYYAFPFGSTGDIPAPGDYDGDGKTDAAIFRSGIWYISRSTSGLLITNFGIVGDIPAPAAYIP